MSAACVRSVYAGDVWYSAGYMDAIGCSFRRVALNVVGECAWQCECSVFMVTVGITVVSVCVCVCVYVRGWCGTRVLGSG